MKKIAVDAMGGDNAPQALVEGVKIGSGSLSDSFKPSGSLMPHTVPFSL